MIKLIIIIYWAWAFGYLFTAEETLPSRILSAPFVAALRTTITGVAVVVGGTLVYSIYYLFI